MSYLPRFQFALLSLVIIIFALTALGGEAAATNSRCKHLTPDKMALCQQKSKVNANKPVMKAKPNSKHGIDAKDLLWLLL